MAVKHLSDRLTEEFDLMTDDRQAPASTVDFERALAAGRRRMRSRRRAARLSGAGALVLAALVAVSLLTAGKPAPPPGAAGSNADPLAAYASFGWLPTKLTGTMYSQEPLDYISTTTAYDPQSVAGGRVSVSARLLVWTHVGSTPPDGSGVPPGRRPAEDLRERAERRVWVL